MKSRITIDLGWDNQPVIKIDYIYSEDVRDKMVKRFLETFGNAAWARFSYLQSSLESPYGGVSKTAEIRPLQDWQLEEQQIEMKYFIDYINKGKLQISEELQKEEL